MEKEIKIGNRKYTIKLIEQGGGDINVGIWFKPLLGQKRLIGDIDFEDQNETGYANISFAQISPSHRNRGLYKEVLLTVLPEIKKLGFKGIRSYNRNSDSEQA